MSDALYDLKRYLPRNCDPDCGVGSAKCTCGYEAGQRIFAALEAELKDAREEADDSRAAFIVSDGTVDLLQQQLQERDAELAELRIKVARQMTTIGERQESWQAMRDQVQERDQRIAELECSERISTGLLKGARFTGNNLREMLMAAHEDIATVENLREQLGASEAECARLREAIRPYADSANWDQYRSARNPLWIFRPTLSAKPWDYAKAALQDASPVQRVIDQPEGGEATQSVPRT